MLKRLTTVCAALAAIAACSDTPTAPHATPVSHVTQYDFAHSGNLQASFLLRDEEACGVFLQPDPAGDVSNFDGRYYLTTTSSGVENLNCTGATLRPGQTPAKTINFKWEFSGWVCLNRITKSGHAHANCHGKT